MTSKTNLDIVNECDNFPYDEDVSNFRKASDSYYSFMLDGYDISLGYILPSIAERMLPSEHWTLDKDRKRLTFRPRTTDGSAVTDFKHRNSILAEYLQILREKKIFKVLSGWRNELYPIYGPDRKLLLNMERSASALFGIVTYGVHMTAFVRTQQGMKLWTPRRSDHKQTYPGMMDNTVAGGLSTGEMPLGCLMRESDEEASLPESITRRAQACGTLTYFHIRDARAGGETGLCQPECQFIYDLELPADVVPKPQDGETVDFKLMDIEETQAAIAAGRFKPNCALVLLEFFVRHGILAPENEPNYAQIIPRLHRKLAFPMG